MNELLKYMMYDLDLSKLSNHELMVLKELSDFISHHQPSTSLSAIDNIVLVYVVGVLDDLGNEDEFDVENFVEMIAAYVPGFGSIENAVVCEWIFELSERLQRDGSKDACLLLNAGPQEEQIPPSHETSQRQSDQVTIQQSDLSKDFNSHGNKQMKTAQDQEHFETDIPSQNSPTQEQTITLATCFATSENELKRSKGKSPDDKVPSLETKQLHCLQETVDIPNVGETCVEGKEESGQASGIAKSHETVLKQIEMNQSAKHEPPVGATRREQIQQILDILPDTDLGQIQECLKSSGGDLDVAVERLFEKISLGDSGSEKATGLSGINGNQVIVKTTPKRGKERRPRRRSRNTPEANRDISRRYKENIVPVDQQDTTETSDARKQTVKMVESNTSDSEHLLLELFPSASSVDAQQCLAIAKGDVEVAGQLLMERLRSGEHKTKPVINLPKAKVLDEKKHRQLLVQKYGFVEADEETKEHRPFLPKATPGSHQTAQPTIHGYVISK